MYHYCRNFQILSKYYENICHSLEILFNTLMKVFDWLEIHSKVLSYFQIRDFHLNLAIVRCGETPISCIGMRSMLRISTTLKIIGQSQKPSFFKLAVLGVTLFRTFRGPLFHKKSWKNSFLEAQLVNTEVHTFSKQLFCTMFNWHNLEVHSANFQANLD